VHDYLKYLKFGYGRATDDASMEIRHGRMSREEGMEMVRQYDANEPSSLGYYCGFLGISKDRFYSLVDNQRDPRIWQRGEGGLWQPTDAVWRHPVGPDQERARVAQVEDRTLAPENRNLYFNPACPPEPKGDPRLDQRSIPFKVI